MDEIGLRRTLLLALEDANSMGIPDEARKEAFVAGRMDIAFADLDMDSLATMQFCIAIEARTDLLLVPGELRRLRSLNQVVDALLSKSR